MSAYTIKLIPKKELHSILPFFKLLNKEVSESILKERLDAMQQQNYECVGVFEGDDLIGISGLWFLNKHYIGKHVEPDNVIIHPDHRGKGIGEELMKWIFDYARSKGCEASELNCYVKNRKGVEFWKSQGYKIIGYHFQKKL